MRREDILERRRKEAINAVKALIKRKLNTSFENIRSRFFFEKSAKMMLYWLKRKGSISDWELDFHRDRYGVCNGVVRYILPQDDGVIWRSLNFSTDTHNGRLWF